MQKVKLYKLHRLLSTTVLVLSMIWILSGFMHPIMSWAKPKSAVMRPPKSILVSQERLAIRELVKQKNLEKVHQVRLINFESKDVYQIIGKTVRYFDAESGDEIENGDDHYAALLAKHYSGRNETVSEITEIKKFDYKYPFINRLLPVKKVSLKESGEDYYIHTRSARLGTVGNTLKDSFSWFFKMCHNLSFLDFSHWFKFIVMSLSMLVIAFTGFTGVWLFLKTRKQNKQKLRKWHSWVGLFAAQVIFLMTFSGFFHIAVKTVSMSSVKFSPPATLKPDSWKQDFEKLNNKNFSEMSIVHVVGEDFLRSVEIFEKGRKEVSYVSLQSGEKKSDKEIAIKLASSFSGRESEELDQAQFIPKFTSEYGFVNKRLPVWKIDFKGSENSYYVETSSQKLASVVTPLKRVEGFSFAYLHKAHYLDFMGKDMRDIVLMFFCILIGFTAVTGIIIKKRKKSSS